jgi:hypothetical protein
MYTILISVLVIGLILYAAWIVIYSIRNNKSKSGFVDVTGELLKQIQTVEYMKKHDPNIQLNAYIPHLDILNKYESSANALLTPLQNNINTDVLKRTDVLFGLEKSIGEMESYAAKKLVNKYQVNGYNTLKSHNNGAEITLNKLGETGKYTVNMNGSCLSVPENNDYVVVPCNDEDKSQQFNLDFVYNMSQYRNKLDSGYPKLDVIGKVKFPFVFLKAASNKNCVKNVNGQISVEPCREYTGQRWVPVEKLGSC